MASADGVEGWALAGDELLVSPAGAAGVTLPVVIRAADPAGRVARWDAPGVLRF